LTVSARIPVSTYPSITKRLRSRDLAVKISKSELSIPDSTPTGGRTTVSEPKRFFVYFIRSSEGRTYIGSTQDVEKRLKQHNAKANRGWTNRFTGWELVYQEECATRLEARRRERELKNIRGTKKFKVLTGIEPLPAEKSLGETKSVRKHAKKPPKNSGTSRRNPKKKASDSGS
jgi:putative endonuclease